MPSGAEQKFKVSDEVYRVRQCWIKFCHYRWKTRLHFLPQSKNEARITQIWLNAGEFPPIRPPPSTLGRAEPSVMMIHICGGASFLKSFKMCVECLYWVGGGGHNENNKNSDKMLWRVQYIPVWTWCWAHNRTAVIFQGQSTRHWIVKKMKCQWVQSIAIWSHSICPALWQKTSNVFLSPESEYISLQTHETESRPWNSSLSFFGATLTPSLPSITNSTMLTHTALIKQSNPVTVTVKYSNHRSHIHMKWIGVKVVVTKGFAEEQHTLATQRLCT